MEKILNEAMLKGVNDIYISPTKEEKYVIKFHVNGKLKISKYVENTNVQRLIASIKYRAHMDIAEKRRPQIGRFIFGKIWIRVSTVGDFLNRETVVLRFIYTNQQQQNWVDDGQFKQLRAAIPNSGLFVIAGPTGSGKTSTLYRLLNNIAAEKLVLTIEDPVEIQQHQFIQLQVNTSAQMDYDALIKVALRHRPEVLLVGEIRDTATAKATIRAALSGHLVFSTVHAMSARDVVLRLLDLGIKSEQLKLALGGVVYQRLITTISGTQAALIDYLSEGLIKRIIAGESVEKFSNMWRETLQYALKHNIISKAVYETYKAI